MITFFKLIESLIKIRVASVHDNIIKYEGISSLVHGLRRVVGMRHIIAFLCLIPILLLAGMVSGSNDAALCSQNASINGLYFQDTEHEVGGHEYVSGDLYEHKASVRAGSFKFDIDNDQGDKSDDLRALKSDYHYQVPTDECRYFNIGDTSICGFPAVIAELDRKDDQGYLSGIIYVGTYKIVFAYGGRKLETNYGSMGRQPGTAANFTELLQRIKITATPGSELHLLDSIENVSINGLYIAPGSLNQGKEIEFGTSSSHSTLDPTGHQVGDVRIGIRPKEHADLKSVIAELKNTNDLPHIWMGNMTETTICGFPAVLCVVNRMVQYVSGEKLDPDIEVGALLFIGHQEMHIEMQQWSWPATRSAEDLLNELNGVKITLAPGADAWW